MTPLPSNAIQLRPRLRSLPDDRPDTVVAVLRRALKMTQDRAREATGERAA